jgi:isocitrate dehydrogenase (NAD+)
MLGFRSLAGPSRQCLRQARQQHFIRPSFQRSYVAAALDKVAHFKGTKGGDGNYTVSLIEGDGIGPEISQSVKDIFKAASVPIAWEPVDVTPRLNPDGKTVIPDETIESISRNYVALKGPLAVRHLFSFIQLSLLLWRPPLAPFQSTIAPSSTTALPPSSTTALAPSCHISQVAQYISVLTHPL